MNFWKPRRLLLIRIEATYIQLLLLNKESKLYGVEECYSLKFTEDDETLDKAIAILREELIKFKEQWQLEEDKFSVAIALSELYQEEFTLPLLSVKQLKKVLQEEIVLRVPMEVERYCSGYTYSREGEEYNVQLVALEKDKLEKLVELMADLQWKLDWLSSLVCIKEQELGEVELWNCLHKPEQRTAMLEEYRELVCFGRACLEKAPLPNLIKRVVWWNEGNIRRQAAVCMGGFIFLSCLFAYPWLYYTTERQQAEIANLQQELLVLKPWSDKRNGLIKLQQELQKREALYKQLKLREENTSVWLELLGRLTPADCWLTRIEQKKEGIYIKGCFQQKGSVELLRKQLLATGRCHSCELVESNMELKGKKGAFTLKVVL